MLGFSGSSAGKEFACNARDPDSIPRSGRSPGEGIGCPLQCSWAYLVAQLVKNPPAMQETWVWPWIRKIPWRRAWQPTPVFLPGESPWTEEPSRLHSMGLQRVGHDWTSKHSTVYYVKVTLCLSHPLLPHCVQKSILLACVSIPALQIGSSVSFFSIPYMH